MMLDVRKTFFPRQKVTDVNDVFKRPYGPKYERPLRFHVQKRCGTDDTTRVGTVKYGRLKIDISICKYVLPRFLGREEPN